MERGREPYIYADFQKLDDNGRVILSMVGAARDLNGLGRPPVDGERVRFYSDDGDDSGVAVLLVCDGMLIKGDPWWLGEFDPGRFRHEPLPLGVGQG